MVVNVLQAFDTTQPAVSKCMRVDEETLLHMWKKTTDAVDSDFRQ